MLTEREIRERVGRYSPSLGINSYSASMIYLLSLLDEARARVAELEEGLATRGTHILDCAAHCGQACSCGLAALLAGGEKR